jgi:hypothetical protein
MSMAILKLVFFQMSTAENGHVAGLWPTAMFQLKLHARFETFPLAHDSLVERHLPIWKWMVIGRNCHIG